MRLKYFDVAKGITLVFILMAHSCGFPLGIEIYCIAYFVALFFVVSGYNQKNIVINKQYIYKRVKKIVFPYFFYNLLIYIIYFLVIGFETIKDAKRAVFGIFYSTYCLYYPISTDNNIFFYTIYNNAMWFLTAFFCADMVFLFYRKYCNKTLYKVTVFVIFIILTQLLYYCPIFLPWNIDKAFIGADFMIAGYELKQKNVLEVKDKRIKVLSAFVLVVIYKILVDLNPGINLATREYGNKGIFSAGLYLIIGIIGSILCIWISQVISKMFFVGSLFEVIGKESLPIMAMHLIIYRIFDRIVQPKMPNGQGSIYYWGVSFLRISITCMIILGAVYGLRYVNAKKHNKVYMG